jgi:hypothetical protein
MEAGQPVPAVLGRFARRRRAGLVRRPSHAVARGDVPRGGEDLLLGDLAAAPPGDQLPLGIVQLGALPPRVRLGLLGRRFASWLA